MAPVCSFKARMVYHSRTRSRIKGVLPRNARAHQRRAAQQRDHGKLVLTTTSKEQMPLLWMPQSGRGQTISHVTAEKHGYKRLRGTTDKPSTSALPPGHTPFTYLHAPPGVHVPTYPPPRRSSSGHQTGHGVYKKAASKAPKRASGKRGLSKAPRKTKCRYNF